MADDIQQKLQKTIGEYSSAQKECQKALLQKQQLQSQLAENSAVKVEFDILKDNAEVYKLIGPVLVKQELTEAKQNVDKRMDYIQGELNRLDDSIASLDTKQDSLREKLAELQMKLRQHQQPA